MCRESILGYPFPIKYLLSTEYTTKWRQAATLKFFAEEHNTVIVARASTWTICYPCIKSTIR